ncbi:MAG: SoxR reducing system RseC family protein [Mariprofundaceae bacterium]|nr:SoxR reducing system RseC family protein [Mariprofundaceae bacterium]
MRQQVYITRLIGDTAMVTGDRQSSCGSCAGKKSCSTLGSWQSKPVEMRVDNPLAAQVGDSVDIEVDDHLVLKASFRLYALPMIAFLIAGFFGWGLANLFAWGIDVTTSIAAIAGVIACYYWIWRQDGKQDHTVAKVVAIHR